MKDYTSLKDRIKPYLKIYSKDADKLTYLYFYLAEADYYLNNFPEAIDEYEKSILNSNDDKMQALSKLGMGWAYLKLKRYAEAQSVLSQIKVDKLEKKSQDVLWLARAILYFETNKFEEAKNIYNELLNKTSDPLILIQAYLGKADALYNTNLYKEAISVYKEALEKVAVEFIPQETIGKLHYGLAWAHLKEGEFKQAID